MEENTKGLLADGDEQVADERDGELISCDWNGDGASETKVTEDDWDAPAPEDDDAANQSGAGSPGESFRLKHLGREFDVSRDEIITLAQKGVDYDRIRNRADTLAENLRQRDAAGGAGFQRRDQETQEFISVYKGVRPEDIPQEVWNEVSGGRTLLSAYQSYENKALKAELEAQRREAQNRQRSTGPRPTLGAVIERDEMETDWYRD